MNDMAGGVGVSGPAEIEVEAYEVATTWLRITITEGKNRQVCYKLLQSVAVSCSELLGIAVGCSVLQCAYSQWQAADFALPLPRATTARCVAVSCRVLQSVGVCCWVLQCVKMWL